MESFWSYWSLEQLNLPVLSFLNPFAKKSVVCSCKLLICYNFCFICSGYVETLRFRHKTCLVRTTWLGCYKHGLEYPETLVKKNTASITTNTAKNAPNSHQKFSLKSLQAQLEMFQTLIKKISLLSIQTQLVICWTLIKKISLLSQ